MMKNLCEVSDELREVIKQYIPKRVNYDPVRGGRSRVDDRTVFNAILSVARTGCQWNALNATGNGKIGVYQAHMRICRRYERRPTDVIGVSRIFRWKGYTSYDRTTKPFDRK